MNIWEIDKKERVREEKDGDEILKINRQNRKWY